MAALPYIPLYVADYLADTAHLTAIEHGAYLMLIMNYWQRGKSLPDDDNKLARIARVAPAEWPGVRDHIAEFFKIEDGEWRHGRIEAELSRVHQKSTKAKAAAQRSVSVRSASAKQTVSHTETDTEADTETKIARLGRDDAARPILNKGLGFPAFGPVGYSEWGPLIRQHAPGLDVDVVAKAFREWCARKAIPLDGKSIGKTLIGFCKTLRAAA